MSSGPIPTRPAIAALCLLLLACACAVSRPGDPERYQLVYEGNLAFDEGALDRVILDNLIDFVESDYAKAAIDDAAFAIEIHYRDAGYPFAQVEYEYMRTGDRVEVRLLVEEGPQTRLETVLVEGGELFTDEQELSFFADERLALGSREPGLFVRSLIDAGAGALVSGYRSFGYLDCRAEVLPPEFSEDFTSARVHVRIDQGPQYSLDAYDVELTGTLLWPEAELREVCAGALLSGLERVAGDQNRVPFVPRLSYQVRGALETHYSSHGRPDVEVVVEPRFDEQTARVSLVAEVRPGPLVRIRALVFPGELQARESFLRSRMTIGPGELYDSAAVQRSFRRLHVTGLFESVDLELVPIGEEQGQDEVERDLVITLVELRSLELYFEPGLGSWDGLRAQFGVQEKSLFGTKYILSAEGVVSQKTLMGELSLTDRWFLNSNVLGTAALQAMEHERPSFTEQALGGRLTFHQRWGDRFSTIATYRYRKSEVVESELGAGELPPEDIDIGSIAVTPQWDTRWPNIFVPRGGSLSSVTVDWGAPALGSQLDYLRLGVRHARYLELSERWRLAAHARIGVIVPLGSTLLIPIQERYFNGGENSVRSFREDQLGPKDLDGTATGGEGWTLGSLEARYFMSSNWHVALFGDAGNVALRHEDVLKFEDLRGGLGLGLRYALPIGPVRADIAWNPSPRDGEDDYVVHFALGLAF